MSSAPLPRFERDDAAQGLASWYTAGRSDGFGDRLLMFDNTGATSLELLRFRSDLATEPGFEDMLRQRVQRLANFRHAAFATIRAVEHLDGGEGLALVSNHTAGKRLSELLEGPRPATGLHPALVSWIVQQVTPLLAALQAHGYDIVHGALTLDRVILTADGRAVIVEHALGSALRGLELSPSRLWRDFGIVARPTSRGEACLDARGDIMQLGVMILSLLLGRRLPLEDVQSDLPKLLDEFVSLPTSRASLFADPLRRWLERALQLHPQAYRSAAEAQDGLHELPEPAVSTLPALLQSLMPGFSPDRAPAVERPALAWAGASSSAEASPGATADEPAVAPSVVVEPVVAAVADDEPATVGVYTRPEKPASPSPITAAPPIAEPKRVVNLAPLLVPAAADIDIPDDRGSTMPAPRELQEPSPFALARSSANRPGASNSLMRLLTPALGLVALAEAAVIAALVLTRPTAPASTEAPAVSVTVEGSRPGGQVFVNERPAGTTPLRLTLDGTARTIRIDPGAAPAASGAAAAANAVALPAPNDATAAALAQAAARQRSGGVRFTSSIPLQVFEGNRVLGSTDQGPIVTTPGTHQLDLVNADLGFRTRQSVTVLAGEIATFTVVTPIGRLSLNAQPWAQVWVDQSPVGETPIANLAVTVGQHEVTFRHPQLGERKELVIVRADGVTRLSTTFGR